MLQNREVKDVISERQRDHVLLRKLNESGNMWINHWNTQEFGRDIFSQYTLEDSFPNI